MIDTRHTPQTGIKIAHITGLGDRGHVSFWQHIDTNDRRNAQVGPQYRSKAELLADHEDYLRRAGWLR